MSDDGDDDFDLTGWPCHHVLAQSPRSCGSGRIRPDDRAPNPAPAVRPRGSRILVDQQGNQEHLAGGRSGGAFRFHAARVFLTYPQCDASLEDLETALIERHGAIKYYAWCRADHAAAPGDECTGKHIHAYVEFSATIDSTDPRCFDFQGFHPNIQSPRSKLAVVGYIRANNGLLQFAESARQIHVITQALKSATIGSCRSILLEEGPTHLKSWPALRSVWCELHTPEWPIQMIPRERSIYTEVPAMTLWVETYVFGPKRDRYPVLIIVSPTMWGKTSWARSIVRETVYWKGTWDMANMKSDAKLLILDDITWDKIPEDLAKIILLGTEGVVTDKYLRKVPYPPGVPCIFLTNNRPSLNSYWVANSVCVELCVPLFLHEEFFA